MSDQFNLQRFVDAQAGVYQDVLAELRSGAKRSHWMWFIFPQLAGLGRSSMAQHYAIASLAEARAYLAHPLLGGRLRECTDILLGLQGVSAHQVFGSPDDMKLHSSLTLFAQAAPQEPRFTQCLARYYGGVADAATLGLLGGQA